MDLKTIKKFSECYSIDRIESPKKWCHRIYFANGVSISDWEFTTYGVKKSYKYFYFQLIWFSKKLNRKVTINQRITKECVFSVDNIIEKIIKNIFRQCT